MILVCGLPGSGNQFVCQQIVRGIQRYRDGHGGGKNWTAEYCTIWHGPKPNAQALAAEEQVRLVMPVRNEHCRLESVGRRAICMDDFPPEECRMAVCKLVVETGAQLLIVSYEALVADPKQEGKRVTDFLGLPAIDWPVHDANHKYLGRRPGMPDHRRETDALARLRAAVDIYIEKPGCNNPSKRTAFEKLRWALRQTDDAVA